MVILHARDIPHGHPSRGFTLIELMVGLGLAALLMLVVAPLTSAWIDGVRQAQARSNVISAVGRAKALALRNGEGRTVADVAAKVAFDDGQIRVVNASGNVVWSADVPSSVSLKLPNDDAFECTAYNNRGLQIGTAATGCTQQASRLTVATDTREAIHVDFL